MEKLKVYLYGAPVAGNFYADVKMLLSEEFVSCDYPDMDCNNQYASPRTNSMLKMGAADFTVIKLSANTEVNIKMAFELGHLSGRNISGLVVYYPEDKPDGPRVTSPWLDELCDTLYKSGAHVYRSMYDVVIFLNERGRACQRPATKLFD